LKPGATVIVFGDDPSSDVRALEAPFGPRRGSDLIDHAGKRRPVGVRRAGT